MATARALRSTAGLDGAMSKTPLLEHVPRRAVQELIARGSVRHYRRGTYLFYQGDPSNEVFFILAGRVAVRSISSTGHRQLLTTLDPPQFFGELGILGEQHRTAPAVALDEP